MQNPLKRLALAFGLVGVVALGILSVVFIDPLAEGVIGASNLNWYMTPSELLAKKGVEGQTVRLGGMARPGPNPEWERKLPLEFFITDATDSVPVVATGAPPAMFKAGIGVVVEGKLGNDGVFHTDRVMVKHSNEYRAPDDDRPHDPAATMMPE
jgi:cytochrome c-type biogenesis protein CcmE